MNELRRKAIGLLARREHSRAELARVRGLPKTAETVSKIPNALKGNEEDNR